MSSQGNKCKKVVSLGLRPGSLFSEVMDRVRIGIKGSVLQALVPETLIMRITCDHNLIIPRALTKLKCTGRSTLSLNVSMQ